MPELRRLGSDLALVLIEDDAEDAFLVQEYLAEAAPGVEVAWVQTIAAALALLSSNTECVLLDLGLPDAVGFSGLDAVLEKCPQAAVIVLTGLVDEERGLAAVARGAQDYLQKGQLEPQLLARTIRYALERKRAEEAARKLTARAAVMAELDKEKNQFLADVSAELRTPLTLITAPLSDLLAGAGGKLTSNQRDLVELAARNTERMSTLVDGLLGFSQIEAGEVSADVVAVDLARVTAAVMTNFAPAVERAGLAFDVSTPPLSRPVYLDPGMWERIAATLLSNAVKFTLEGVITVRLSESTEYVQLSVEDTGVGIEEADLARLFESFAKIEESGGRTQEGAGIGLSVACAMVRLMDGSIDVESTVGKGSIFTVRIPRVDVPVGDPGAVVAVPSVAIEADVREVMSWDEEPLAVRAARPGRARVLIAEDNADMRAYLTDVLSELFDVEAVADGEAALFAARKSAPDLVLSDVMMPGLDGFALLAELRSDPDLRTVPVILLSARAGEEAAVEGLAAGADDYIVKPFSSNDLIARVEANLERARERTRDLAWRNAMLSSLTEGVMIADAEGTLLDMNLAFEAITGYGRADLPYPVPHPWWPDPAIFPVERAMLDAASAAIFAAGGGDFEALFVSRDGREVWVAGTVASVEDPSGPSLITASARDVTRERSVRARQGAASQLSSELVHQLDLAELQAATVLGFGAVFSGDPVLFTDPEGGAAPEAVITAAGSHAFADLPAAVLAAIQAARCGVEVSASDPVVPGLLIRAQAPTERFCVWVQFPTPRRVVADERVLASILGDMLATAKDRAARESAHTHTEEHLRNALDGQRAVAQAVGILIERHRLTHQGAFERLREASNRRNVKMRDLAERLVDTGEEP